MLAHAHRVCSANAHGRIRRLMARAGAEAERRGLRLVAGCACLCLRPPCTALSAVVMGLILTSTSSVFATGPAPMSERALSRFVGR